MAKFMPQDEWAYADALCSLAAGGTVDQQQQQQQQQNLPADESSPSATVRRVQIDTQPVAAGRLPAAAPPAAGGLQVHSCSEIRQAGTAEQQQQQQQQQQDGLLVMPWWLKALAAVVAGDILSRPDTFR
jgi:hypothetical protein